MALWPDDILGEQPTDPAQDYQDHKVEIAPRWKQHSQPRRMIDTLSQHLFLRLLLFTFLFC